MPLWSNGMTVGLGPTGGGSIPSRGAMDYTVYEFPDTNMPLRGKDFDALKELIRLIESGQPFWHRTHASRIILRIGLNVKGEIIRFMEDGKYIYAATTWTAYSGTTEDLHEAMDWCYAMHLQREEEWQKSIRGSL